MNTNARAPDERVPEDDENLYWREEASCARAIQDSPYFLDLWFQEENTLKSYIASTICFRCPVRQECLQNACKLKDPEGIWGGLPASLRKKRGQAHNYTKLVCLPSPYETTDETSVFHLKNLGEGASNE